MTTLDTRLLSVTIARPWPEVYAFAAVPANMATWAAGLGSGFREEDSAWVCDTPAGAVRVRFSPANPFGVLDHWVTLPDGTEVYIPLRVHANGDGADVVFTLHRQPGMADDALATDAAAVQRDLDTLKRLLES